jgi:hypothetical protein
MPLTVISSPTAFVTSTAIPSITLTPSAIPTYPLELLKDKWPSTTPAYGFVVLEMPASVHWDEMMTVTILTVPSTECSILYFGTSGLSHAAGLEPQIADANGICSWTWKQAEILGKKGAALLPIKAKIYIVADRSGGNYELIVK